MSEDLRVFEFGNTFHVSKSIETNDPILKDMVEHSIEQAVGPLKYIADFKVIKDPEILEMPAVDILRRFKVVGWKAKYASDGYFELKKHFECRDRHIPKEITIKFIWKMIKELIEQRKVKDYE